MKIIYILISLLLVPATLLAGGNPKSDTVIIELNDNSKIIIYTKNKEDLADLQKYDINEMIKDLNSQLVDSVEYLVIEPEEEGEYDNDNTTEDDDSDEIKFGLGGMSVEVDPDEIEELDENEWRRRKKITYDADRIDRTTHHFNVDIGFNNWIEDGSFPDANNSPYSIKPFGSWYVGFNSISRTWVGGSLFLDWGLGINWFNWKFEDADYQAIKTDTRVEFVDDPNRNGLKSKLTASYINAQIVPMLDFSRGRRRVTSVEATGVRFKRYRKKGIRFGVGGFVGYRLGSHTKFIYKEGGSREKDKENDNFYLENIRYGIRAQIGWKGVELFGTYDLNKVFSAGRGPAGSPGLNAVSFGITL